MPQTKILIISLVWGWFLIGTAPTAFAARPELVEVNLFQAYADPKYFLVTGPLHIVSPEKKMLPSGSYRIEAGTASGASVRVIPMQGSDRGKAVLDGRQVTFSGSGDRPLSLTHPQSGTRRYRGRIRISSPDSKTVLARNIVKTRDYIVAVLGSETLRDWTTEALKAQAVLTQSRLARYKRGDSLDDTTQAEAYLGADYERTEARHALDQVWGRVLTYRGLPVEPFYHSTCAGGTSDGGELFKGNKGAIPYAPAVVCRFCRTSPFWKSTVKFVPKTVFSRLHTNGIPKVIRRDSAGRPIAFQENGKAPYNAYDFWIRTGQTLGWDKIPGTRFTMTPEKDGGVDFQSTGAGHGVGLCQWGANEQCRQGRTYIEVLKYYFPMAEVRRID